MSRARIVAIVGVICAAVAFLSYTSSHRETGTPVVAPDPPALAGGSQPRRADGKGRGSRARRVAAEARQRLLKAILAEQSRRKVTPPTTGSSGVPHTPGTLDSRYVDRQVDDIMPLVGECYENALRDRPALEGRLDVRFVVMGEPGIGAVVEQAEILGTSTIDDPGLRECVRETLYAIELEAPEQGGGVEVLFPFDFRPATKP